MAHLTCDVAILGSGPYGLAAAAHVGRIRGLDVKVFGEPMEFWKCHMPEGMFLRSPWSASDISDPELALTLNAFRDANGHVPVPIPLDRFVEYGLWFQRQIAPNLDRRKVVRIQPDGVRFRLRLDDDDEITAGRVVVAAGIGPFARRLSQFKDVPPNFVTHSSDQRDVRRFNRKRVVVVGAGQSALESAALIHEAGGSVELIARTASVHWLTWKDRIQRLGPIAKLLYSPYDIGPAGVSRIVALPDLVQWFPRGVQDRFRVRALRPAGARWLVDRMKDIPFTTGRSVVAAVPSGDELHLQLDDGGSRRVDHVVLGTGYHVDVSRYPFMPAEISQRLNRVNGFPKLSSGFESSMRGLHFLGAPSAWSYGPLMYFVAGTEYGARTLARHIARSGPKSSR